MLETIPTWNATIPISGPMDSIFSISPARPTFKAICGKYDLSFDLGEPERYSKDVPNAEVHVLDAGHFALDTAADEIAALVQRSTTAATAATAEPAAVEPKSVVSVPRH